MIQGILALLGVMFAAAPWIINAAPYESTMGLVQKIFYFHFPSAVIFLIAAMASGVYSAMYLFGKKASSDWRAHAFAELAVVFGLLALITGPLWARKAWGVWWVWDARLTSELILLFLYFGYMALQAAIDERRRRHLFARGNFCDGLKLRLPRLRERYGVHQQ